tara:strand:- start:681 stop:1181 length:501 start_codon:yes stop_codon:yes gene_type:complete
MLLPQQVRVGSYSCVGNGVVRGMVIHRAQACLRTRTKSGLQAFRAYLSARSAAALQTKERHMQLKGKSVVVTGGSDGIGRHICLKLGAEGCTVAVLGRNQERLDALVAETRDAGATRAMGFACDMRDPDQIAATVAAISVDLGPVDIVINNAGIWHKAGPLDSIAP